MKITQFFISFYCLCGVICIHGFSHLLLYYKGCFTFIYISKMYHSQFFYLEIYFLSDFLQQHEQNTWNIINETLFYIHYIMWIGLNTYFHSCRVQPFEFAFRKCVFHSSKSNPFYKILEIENFCENNKHISG